MVAVESELTTIAAPPGGDAIPLALRRRGGTPRQVFVLTLVGTLLLALFASADLSSWLDRMGDGPVLVPLQNVATEWDGAMQRLNLTRPAAALRAAMHRLLDAEW
ncbi:MAG TPA: hypothetical protein VME41_15145 [Stellaceae bacterium]|nr:hypothetical protein [Stellaceae bacterium]